MPVTPCEFQIPLVVSAPLAPALDLQHQGGDVVPEFSADMVTIIAETRCPKARPFVRVCTAIIDDRQRELAKLLFAFGHI